MCVPMEITQVWVSVIYLTLSCEDCIFPSPKHAKLRGSLKVLRLWEKGNWRAGSGERRCFFSCFHGDITLNQKKIQFSSFLSIWVDSYGPHRAKNSFTRMGVFIVLGLWDVAFHLGNSKLHPLGKEKKSSISYSCQVNVCTKIMGFVIISSGFIGESCMCMCVHTCL